MNDIRAEYESLKVKHAALVVAYDELAKKHQSELRELREKYDKVVETLAWFQRQMFGSKSERFVPSDNGQTSLPLFGAAPQTPTPLPVKKVESYERAPASADDKGHGRSPIPAHIKRVDTVLEPEGDISGLVKIGEEITEELEYNQATFVVNRTIRPKYAKPDGSDTVVVADLPPRLIEKGRPGPGLLAHTHIAKFVDHTPLYRQSKQHERSGISISRSTLEGWIAGTHEKLLPLRELLRLHTLSGAYLQADETPILILEDDPNPERKRKDAKKAHRGFFWPYLNPVLRCMFFDFRNGRGRAGPEEVLKNFNGVLQTDAYAAYESLAGLRNAGKPEPEIILGACLAHVRRKFKEAFDNDCKRAETALTIIKRLYAIEAEAREKNMTADERHALRQNMGAPAIMAEFKAWLTEQAADTSMLPHSTIGKAVAYALERWTALQVYLTHGYIEIDNNLVENAIRPVALGRKNWLFCGSSDGAKRAALILSLVGTCKLQDIEPFGYLKNLFEELPKTPDARLADLLPIKR